MEPSAAPGEVPGAETIVRIWERGRQEHPIDRALTMLALFSGRPRAELAARSVESRDRLLLAWRTRLFGPSLAGFAACPACGCAVDVSLTPDGLEAQDDEPFPVSVGDGQVTARMPTSLDLAAIASCGSVEAARRILARRVIQGSDADGAPVPDGALAAVEAELDRRAGVSAGVVALACPDCGQGWPLELDVPAFTWREIEILAARLLRDVDVLARRYGWSEQEILGLSAPRRRFYLELAS